MSDRDAAAVKLPVCVVVDSFGSRGDKKCGLTLWVLSPSVNPQPSTTIHHRHIFLHSNAAIAGET